MSLGVLNNLSAVYAENNLNNTSNSLSKTLQQLSSGSKINSGADDAAGLSLVNGLQANQQALTQSQTNSTEGVGLLQVADGALSQVTSLLNRAVTLATEASNGTLNSTQDAAANQEYQSILSEVSNIGSTTTYNQNQVFNTNTAIYTGDSTQTGASIDQLNIRSLSSSNLGDTGGAMAYGSGNANGNVFVDLSNNPTAGTSEAQLTDSLTTGGATLYVNTLSSTGTVIQNSVSVGGSSGYADTVQGMISAINNSGLGVTASYTSAAVAGATSTSSPAVLSTDMGIEISGSVGAGSAPSQSSFSGSATAKNAANTDVVSGSMTFQVGNSAAVTVTAAQVAAEAGKAQGAVTLNDFKSYINTDAALGVTAGDTTGGVLTLNSTSSTNPSLQVTSNLVDNSLTTGPATLTYTATASYSDGVVNHNVIDQNINNAGTADPQTVNSTVNLGTATSGGGTATISYTDKAGQSLSGTDLSTQADAESALTNLNAAIADVSAQDGYIGAQINTLNAVSQVLSTQSENVTSAQNAVQATDYASATSNMSKYEILSQTGISALAQANSMQQEVTKLLQ
jgi:flagellin